MYIHILFSWEDWTATKIALSPSVSAILDIVKLFKIKKTYNHNTPLLSDSEGEANVKLYRVEVIKENTTTSQLKVRYIGYSTSFDEWRGKEDIIDLSGSDPEEDVIKFPSGPFQQFCLFQELAFRIKLSLISSRKRKLCVPYSNFIWQGILWFSCYWRCTSVQGWAEFKGSD